MFEKIKTIWKRFWKFLLVGSATIAIAATVLPPEPIPTDLLLKADKTKILESKEVDWIEEQGNGTLINRGKIISYAYISDKEVPVIEGEDLSKRTSNAQFFKNKDVLIKGKKIAETWSARIYQGTPFYYIPDKDKWYQTEIGTTTIEAFNRQTTSFLQRFTGQNAFALTTTTYSAAGDGRVFYVEATNNWAAAHDAAAGTGFVDDATSAPLGDEHSNPGYIIRRGFLSFDTSAIEDNATISSATTSLYVASTLNTQNDGNDWINIMEGLQASDTGLGVNDYNNCGDAVTNPTEASVNSRKDISTTTSGYYNWSLGTTGLDWISITTSTLLCVREGHDALNITIGIASESDAMTINMSESAGTANDPYLEITYTVPSADTCTCPSPAGNWNMNSGDNCYLTSECNIAGFTLYIHDTGGTGFHILNAGKLVVGRIQTTSSDWTVEAGGELYFRP